MQNNASCYLCSKCCFSTGNKYNYEKHLLTAKHKKITNDNSMTFICDCGNKYANRHNLSRHKKTCGRFAKESLRSEDRRSSTLSTEGALRDSRLGSEGTLTEPPGGAKRRFSIDSLRTTVGGSRLQASLADPLGLSTENDNKSLNKPEIIDTALMIKLINQNENLQNLLIQQAREHQEETKNILTSQNELINKLVEREPTTNINNNTINNNNQKFNLNFFLNETCKDAMNIQEFIENIKVTFQELLTIGNSGFVNGVSDILIKELRDLDITKRPIHCTDVKRETMYFKEENTWNKDDKENTKLKNVIEKIEYKNVAALHDWCNENPDSKVNNTTNNLLRDKIYLETLQGDERTRDKIIKNISKEVIIDKE
jgi:hypothetical protein